MRLSPEEAMFRRIALSVLAGLALLGLLGRRLSSDRPAPELPDPAYLKPWDLTGCYRLEVGPWDFGAGADSAANPARGEGEGAASPLLAPPAVVMLVADSTDEWKRPLKTYRALPMDSASGRLRGLLRWFVRADTLWVVWSDRSTQVGLALFAAGESFVGGARSSQAAAGLEGTARATAWKINCATGLRVTNRPRGRSRR